MAIMPKKLDRVIANRPNALQRDAGYGNKSPLAAVALTEGAGAVTAQIFLGVLSCVAVVPGNSYAPFRFEMIYFQWNWFFHDYFARFKAHARCIWTN